MLYIQKFSENINFSHHQAVNSQLKKKKKVARVYTQNKLCKMKYTVTCLIYHQKGDINCIKSEDTRIHFRKNVKELFSQNI